MKSKQKNIVINSTVLFVLASIWQQNLHEFGHYLMAKYHQASDLRIHHNYVSYDSTTLSSSQLLTIAAAGPMLSLIIGLVFHWVCSHMKARKLPYLFCLFMSAFGYINFGGYLMVSPFFAGGDTGFIFLTLGFPFWVKLIFAALGVLFIYYTMKFLSRYFVQLGSNEVVQDASKRKTFINALVEYPLYIGVLVTTILNLPVVTVLSLLYPLFSPFSLFWGMGYLHGTQHYNQAHNPNYDSLFKLSIPAIIALIMSVILTRIMVPGIL